MSSEARIPEVGDRLRSRDERAGPREVRVIERQMTWDGCAVRRVRVENVITERRTFLRIPLASEWEIVVESPPYGQAPDA